MKLNAMNAAMATIAAGIDWTKGRGAGGNFLTGQRAISTVRPQLQEYINGSSLIVITGGLGGGTGTSGAGVIAGIAREHSTPVVTIMTRPFAFEGQHRIKTCDDALDDIIARTDILLSLPNDLLYSVLPPDTPFKEAFNKADEEIARAIIGITEILRCKNLLASDIGDLNALISGRKAQCSIGVGIALPHENNRGHIAANRMINSPLLGGEDMIKNADVVLVSLLGGDDLSLGEAKKTLESISMLAGKNTKLIIGANTDVKYSASIQITVITVKFERSHGMTDDSSWQSSLGSNSPQLEFDLRPTSRGMFTGTERNDIDGEDFDTPTFQRRHVTIDIGK